MNRKPRTSIEPEQEDTDICTKAVLAVLLHCTPRTITNMMRQRRIPFWRVNARCIRFSKSAVLRHLNSNCLVEPVRRIAA